MGILWDIQTTKQFFITVFSIGSSTICYHHRCQSHQGSRLQPQMPHRLPGLRDNSISLDLFRDFGAQFPNWGWRKIDNGWWLSLPLWKIWVRQWEGWQFIYCGKLKSKSKPPTRDWVLESWDHNFSCLSCWFISRSNSWISDLWPWKWRVSSHAQIGFRSEVRHSLRKIYRKPVSIPGLGGSQILPSASFNLFRDHQLRPRLGPSYGCLKMTPKKPVHQFYHTLGVS